MLAAHFFFALDLELPANLQNKQSATDSSEFSVWLSSQLPEIVVSKPEIFTGCQDSFNKIDIGMTVCGSFGEHK